MQFELDGDIGHQYRHEMVILTEVNHYVNSTIKADEKIALSF